MLTRMNGLRLAHHVVVPHRLLSETVHHLLSVGLRLVQVLTPANIPLIEHLVGRCLHAPKTDILVRAGNHRLLGENC